MRAMNRTLTATLAVAVSLLVTRAATADTRSWTAVKKVLGSGDAIVVGFDLTKLRTTGAYQAGLQLFLADENEAKQVFDSVKSDCGFDVTTVVSDITVVMQKDAENPLIAFGLDGLDEAKVVTCLGIVAGKMTGMPSPKLTGRKIGKITEYSVKGEKKKLYAAWLATDVLVFTDDANDRKKLEKRVAGRGATGALGKYLARTSTTAPFWFAATMNEREGGRTIVGAHGRIDLAGGVWKATGAMVMSTAAEATDMAAEGNAGMAEAKTEMAGKSPELGRAISTVTIGAKGTEVVISGQIGDKDFATIIPQLDHLF
jgi:hypothetical protein